MAWGSISGTFWTPNVTKKGSKLNPKNDLEKRWSQGGPSPLKFGEPGSRRSNYQRGLVIWKTGRLEDWRKGGKDGQRNG